MNRFRRRELTFVLLAWIAIASSAACGGSSLRPRIDTAPSAQAESVAQPGGLTGPSSGPVDALEALGGPLPGVSFSATVVADPNSATTVLYNAWENMAGVSTTLEVGELSRGGGVPTIRRRDLATGADDLLVRGGFAPIPYADGSLAFSRPTATPVSAAVVASDVVVRSSDGITHVVFSEPGRMSFPIGRVGHALLIMSRGSNAEASSSPLLETLMVGENGQVVRRLGLPLAVSPDRSTVLLTAAEPFTTTALHLVDGNTLRDVATVSRADYGRAFVDDKDRPAFVAASPDDGADVWPVAPSGPGVWFGSWIRVPASGRLLGFSATPDGVRPVGVVPVIDAPDAPIAASIGRMWVDPTTGRAVVAITVTDTTAAQPPPPPSTLTGASLQQLQRENLARLEHAQRTVVRSCDGLRCLDAGFVASRPAPPVS